MKTISTLVLSFLMIAFGLIAMPTQVQAESNSYYGEPYSNNHDEQNSYYKDERKNYYHEDPNNYYKDPKKFLDIENAKIGIKDDVIKKIFFETRDEIPTDGSAGAFGYGVVLADGNAIVTTTHAGVLDSILQDNILDPVWHNHFVQLTENTECVSDTAVGDLTFESPGEVIVQDNIALLKNLPPSAIGQFTGETITPGSDVQIVASFILQPLLDLTVFQEDPKANPLVAVCVEDIQPVDPRFIDIFEINNGHYDYDDNYYSNEDKYDEYYNGNDGRY